MELVLTPEGIFFAVLAFSWLEYLWEAYLSYRQRAIYRNQTTVRKTAVEVQQHSSKKKKKFTRGISRTSSI